MPRTGSGEESPLPELTSKLSTDELVKRLKSCLKYLSECNELRDANVTALNKLSSSLLLSFLHNHRSRDVKALTAANIVEIFKLFHPNHPFVDEDLKVVFTLFISQLRGLERPTDPAFKQAFQLLESVVKLELFLLCVLMDASDILADLFTMAFSVISDIQTPKVRNYLLDILVSILLQEGGNFSLSQEILDIILGNILEPAKSSSRAVYSFTVELIRKSSSYIEPPIHKFFNNMLVVGNSSESELGHSLYSLIYELYAIDSTLLLSVLPQLEHKLTSTDSKERRQVTEVLAKMFSPKSSKLAKENRPLWTCFLGRFSDADSGIRILCTSFSKIILINHAHLVEDVGGKLHERILDKDEKVRMGVVKVILEVAQENIKLLPQKLIDDIINRLRDKSWNVRREAMIGLAKLYRKLLSSSSSSEVKLKPSLVRTYSWIPTKLLHCYYMVSAEDRLCVERCVLSALVPVSYGPADRMLRLMHVYARLDDNATKAFDQMLLSRHQLRKHILALADAIQSGKIPDDDTRDHVITSLVIPIARKLPDPVKTQSALKDFTKMLLSDNAMVDALSRIADCALPCEEVQSAKLQLLNMVPSAVKDDDPAHDPVREMMKNLVDACCRVLLDTPCIGLLVEQVSRTLCDCPLSDSQEEEEESFFVAKKAVRLLKVLAPIIPDCFASKDVFNGLVDILNHKDIEIARHTLQILISIGKLIDSKITSCLQPILTKLATSGPVQLAKHAVKCIHHAFSEPRPIFNKLCSTLVEHVDFDDPCYQTVLISLGQLAKLQPEVFSPYHKTVVRDNIVKNLFVVDRDDSEYEFDPEVDPEWCEDNEVSDEARAKVLATKLLVNWLVGDSSGGVKTASPVIRMLSTIIQTNGDLQMHKHVSPTDMSRLRLAAACGLLKLACCPRYSDVISVEQFQSLACVIQDTCQQVRSLFVAKLNKKLISLKLPLGFLSIFALAGNEPEKSERALFRKMVISIVDRRRRTVNELPKAQENQHVVLPEYAIPHAVYLISHHSEFRRTSIEMLDRFRDCLWFFLEPIVVKGDNYSFVYKLLETIKGTVDAQNPEDPEINKNIYCTCDLAMGVLAKKMLGTKLGDFAGDVILPAKFYSLKEAKIAMSQLKYLPPDYDCTPSKQSGVKTEPEGSTPKKPTPQKRMNPAKSSAPAPSKPRTGRRLRGFATSTPAVKPIKPSAPGKRTTPKKRKQRATSSEENGLSDVEETDEETNSPPGPSPVKTGKRGASSPSKRSVRRKVLHNSEDTVEINNKEVKEMGTADMGESGASPPQEARATRRSRRNAAKELAMNKEEVTSPDVGDKNDEGQSDTEMRPSPKRRKVVKVAVKEAELPADETKNTSTGIKRKTRHRR